MAKLLFFNVPAYGHVNPTLPVVTELVRLGHQVAYCNAEAFAGPVRGAGAEFRAYPDSGASEAEFGRRVKNLVSVSVFVLEESLRLLPFVVGAIDRETPDLVVFDSIALWGMQATRLQKVPSAASISTFVQEGVPGILEWRDYAPAYRYAIDAHARHQGSAFEHVELQLQEGWEAAAHFGSRLDWNRAQPAMRHAWESLDNAPPARKPGNRVPFAAR